MPGIEDFSNLVVDAHVDGLRRIPRSWANRGLALTKLLVNFSIEQSKCITSFLNSNTIAYSFYFSADIQYCLTVWNVGVHDDRLAEFTHGFRVIGSGNACRFAGLNGLLRVIGCRATTAGLHLGNDHGLARFVRENEGARYRLVLFDGAEVMC